MPRAWLTIPSARPSAEVNVCISKWKAQGYGIALWRDMKTPGVTPSEFIVSGLADFVHEDFAYPGYAQTCNYLIREVMSRDRECIFAVCAGDDTLPDTNKTADEIARECELYFGAAAFGQQTRVGGTFGVMQPTGDRFAGGSIDRIAGSPWIGREFARRLYRGNGPYWPAFTHMFVDEHLWNVAQMLGVYWTRPDLTHFHNHFMRESEVIDSNAVGRPVPPHLVEANSRAHWDRTKAEFERLKAGGFAEALDLLL